MRVEQEIMYRLLDEVASACDKNNVGYFLIGDELLYYIRKKNPFRCQADICMTLEDYKAVEPELIGNPERVIENIYGNNEMPGVYFRYVHTESLMMELSYHKVRKEHGIAVNIHIIREAGKAAESLNAYEDIMESGIEGVEHIPKYKCKKDFNRLKKSRDFPGTLMKMLEACALTDTGSNNRSILKIPSAGIMTFDKGFWEKSDYIVVAGKKYKTVKDKETYLTKCYGDYKKMIVHSALDMHRIIVDPEIPYGKVADDIISKVDCEEFWERRDRLFDNYFGKYDILTRKHMIINNHLFLVASRVWLWKRYYHNKKKITELFFDKRFDELRLIFNDFDIHIKKHEPYGYIPFFDKEIWDIYLSVLRIQGDAARAKTLEQLYEANPLEEIKNEDMAKYIKGKPEEMKNMRFLDIFR